MWKTDHFRLPQHLSPDLSAAYGQRSNRPACPGTGNGLNPQASRASARLLMCTLQDLLRHHDAPWEMPVSIILMLLCAGISGRQVAPERLKLRRGHRPVRAMVLPVVMYGCESWTAAEAEHQRIDAFELRCWRRLLRVPWTARKSNQSILKEINPEGSLEGLMLKLKLQYFGHLMRTDSFEKTLILGKTEGQIAEDEMVR